MATGVNLGGVNGGGLSGLASLGLDRQRPTLSLLNANSETSSSDSVNLGDAALWSAARSSVKEGVSQLDKALSAGDGVERLLISLQDAARKYSADPSSGRGEIDQLLSSLSKAVEDAEGDGARLVRGQNLSVTAEPGAAPISIPGLDLQVRDAPREGDLIQVPASGEIDGAALEAQVKASLDNLRAQTSRLDEARNALSSHLGLLGAAEGALSASNTDLDADGARLLALQVRQGLHDSVSQSIVNVEPGAVLSLFRA